MMNSQSFLSVFKATPLPILVLLTDAPLFTVAEVNSAFLNLCNSEEKDVIGKPVFEVLHTLCDENQIISGLQDSLQKVISTKIADKIPVYQYHVQHNQGSKTEKRYHECENIPVLSETGEVACIIHTSVDVTEKENALQHLKSNEKKLLAAQQIAKIGYWKLDLRTDKLFWSEEVYNILGVNKEASKLTYDLFFKAIHPEDREMFARERCAVFHGETDMNFEFRVVQPNGTVKWIHEIGKLEKNEKGEPVVFDGTVQDITTRKLLKLSLQESNMRYHYASKATFDAIYDWDYITDTCYWGEGFIRDFGYDAKTLADKDFWQKHVHPEDHHRVLHEIDQLAKGAASNWLSEYRFQKTDGSYAYVLDRSIIIRDKNGKAIRMIGAVQDITEKKNLQQLLDKSNRLARVGSWEIDVESATVYWSDIIKEIRETPPGFKPTLREGIRHFKEGYSRETIIARVKEAITNGTQWQDDLQIYTHKGNLKWVRTIGKAEMVNGRCKKIYGSFQDIDQSKKAELEILKLYEEKDAILESIGDAFCRVEKNWLVTYWNKEAEKLLRTPKNKIVGQYLWDVFSSSIGTDVYKKYHESLETNKSVVFEYFYPDVEKWLEISVFPNNGLSVYFRDITEHKLSQIRLKESEKRYSELFRLNPQPTWVFELETLRFVQVNQAAIDLYGYSEEEFLKMTVLDVRTQEENDALKAKLKIHGQQPTTYKTTSRHFTKSKQLLEVEVQANFLFINGRKYRLAIITDVTERNHREHQVTRAIINTQENERYEIGAELHDNICQILASTHITLGILANSVNQDGKQLFHQCREYISLATKEIRNLSHRLAPAFFNDSTLEDAFAVLLNNINVEKKYHISLYFDELIEKVILNRDLQLNLYRILQEQLRNIVKYADCKNIEVDLIVKNGKIKMRIADDGIGFDVNAVKCGIGLSNMKRRAQLFCGKLDVFSSPGNGCEIEIEIPLKAGNQGEVKKTEQLIQ